MTKIDIKKAQDLTNTSARMLAGMLRGYTVTIVADDGKGNRIEATARLPKTRRGLTYRLGSRDYLAAEIVTPGT
jgi:hypothetical protein